MPEVRFVAHDSHATPRVPLREPAHDAVHTRPGRELRHSFHAPPVVRAADDLGGLERPLVRTRGEQLELGDELFQTQGGAAMA
ncbi:MAG: hypothetical protein DMD60_10445 [Gemmatimonadetes bacterium]|nr:MAG: hypothetical protein DMD60_10445 [Gemmatimonadota bacterium]